MRYSVKSRLLIGAIGVLGALAFATAPASAAPASFTLTGSGTFAPGLALNADPGEIWNYSGTGYAVAAAYIGPISCTVNGNDTIGSLAQSAGAFAGKCTTLVGTEDIAGTYTRTGSAAKMAGQIGPAPLGGNFTASCSFVPGPPPVTAYQQSCTFTVQ
ncbi:MAG: hypothetical protein QOC82_2210 [Frankiaceae bacterium]|jgi:hypothetical protein|nr:hypothetical protein [Frankiaceae bacterium]